MGIGSGRMRSSIARSRNLERVSRAFTIAAALKKFVPLWIVLIAGGAIILVTALFAAQIFPRQGSPPGSQPGGLSTLGQPSRAELSSLGKSAELIALGSVTIVRSQFATNEFGDQIVTSEVLFSVKESLKSKTPSVLTIKTVGGTVGDVTLQSSSEAFFKQGEVALVFLEGGPEVFSVVGGARGKFTIDNKGIVVELGSPWTAVRATILKSLGR